MLAYANSDHLCLQPERHYVFIFVSLLLATLRFCFCQVTSPLKCFLVDHPKIVTTDGHFTAGSDPVWIPVLASGEFTLLHSVQLFLFEIRLQNYQRVLLVHLGQIPLTAHAATTSMSTACGLPLLFLLLSFK